MRSRCHRSKVSGWTRNRPRRAGDRSRLSPARTPLSTGRSAGRATCLRKTATSWRTMTTSMARSCCSPQESRTSWSEPTKGDVEEGECHVPSSSSVSRQQKSRPMGPDDVFGMHRWTSTSSSAMTSRPSFSLSTPTRARPASATAWSSSNITDKRDGLREDGIEKMPF